MASYFPKALMYREWRDGRLVYLAAFLLTLAPGLLTVLNYWLLPTSGPGWQMNVRQFWEAYNGGITEFRSEIVPVGVMAAAWIVVPILRIVSERSRGALGVVLSSPVKRTDWIRMKFWLGFTVLIMSSFVQFVCLWALHFQAPTEFFTTTSMVFREVGIYWILFVSMYALGFFVAMCVTNIIAAVAFTYGILLAPLWLNQVLGKILPNSNVGTELQTKIGLSRMFVPHGTWVYLIQWLSPLNVETLGGFTWQNPWLYWYLVFAAICYISGVAYFKYMRAERFETFLTRASLWYYLLTGFSLVLGSFFAGMLTSARTNNIVHAEQYHAHLFASSFVIFSAVIWFIVWGWAKFRVRQRSHRAGMRTSREG